MKRTFFWLPVVAAMVVAPVLVGCRSGKRCCGKRSAPGVTAPYSPISDAGGAYAPQGGMYMQADGGTSLAPDAFAPADMPPAGTEFPAAGTELPADIPAMGYESESETLMLARQEAERLKAEKAALESQVALARQRADLAEQALVEMPPMPGGSAGMGGGAPISGELGQLASDLRSRSAGAEVVQQGSYVILRLPDAFEPGRDSLKGDSQIKATLGAAADAISRYPGTRVSVVGHSDSTPIVKTKHLWRSNHHLSEARAQSVANYLSQQGVAPDRILDIAGRGASEPIVVPERTRADRARNRRVEIVFGL